MEWKTKKSECVGGSNFKFTAKPRTAVQRNSNNITLILDNEVNKVVNYLISNYTNKIQRLN